MISHVRGTTLAHQPRARSRRARRFSRDVAAGSTSWLPCGVRCSAGELAELVSTDGGATWSTASTNLSAPSCGGGLVRAGGQFVLRDLRGRIKTR